MSALDSGPGETLSPCVQRKNWHRILLISKAEMHGNQEAPGPAPRQAKTVSGG